MVFRRNLYASLSNRERLRTALDAIGAYVNDNDEELARFPKVYAKSYLEYGLMLVAVSSILIAEDVSLSTYELAPDRREVEMDALRKIFASPTKDEAKYLEHLERIWSGGVVALRGGGALSAGEWAALVPIVVACMGRSAAALGFSFDELYQYLYEMLPNIKS